MTVNQIAYHALQETKRANLAKEQETHRSNLENEAIGRTQASAAQSQAAAAHRQADTANQRMLNDYTVALRDLGTKERTATAKEIQAQAASDQASTAQYRAETDRNLGLGKLGLQAYDTFIDISLGDGIKRMHDEVQNFRELLIGGKFKFS